MVPSLTTGAERSAPMPPGLARVLDAIAQTVLGSDSDDPVTLGSVTLRAHQRDALRRVRESIERSGGALLADEPGLGKTFVALAAARGHPPAIVVAPASLRVMWRHAAGQAGAEIGFVSMESLSRRGARIDAYPERGGFVIVDEAHHVSNPRTVRYARLAQLVAYRRALLLSGTPVRNRGSELAALLALFLGPRAHTLDDDARSRCIVRRGDDASLRPAIDGPHWHRVRALAGVRNAIAHLPPALPALDGGEATALVTMSLARCWASSLAALDAALQRRLQRGAALSALLDEGRMPTRGELRAWVVGDDAVQLAFPVLAAHETRDAPRLRATLTTHLDAVRALRARIRPCVERDTAGRAGLLRRLRDEHRDARIVAFTAYASTAEALFRALRRMAGVALLTARGARTAGGARPRADVLRALDGAPRPRPNDAAERRHPARDDISLVIATDVLSEGVNLQGASVIVHLDLPWTAAGLDQRVGRAARMGSPHVRVHVHGIDAPAAADRLLTLERRLRRKQAAQAEAARVPADMERLRETLSAWRNGSGDDQRVGTVVATARSATAGFIATVDVRGEPSVVCGTLRGALRWKLSAAPGDLLAMVRGVHMFSADADPRLEAGARAALGRWLSARRARESSGEDAPPSHARRLLLDHLDAALRNATAASRATLAVRLVRVRALIHGAITAGAERTLGDLARFTGTDLESCLTACEARLGGMSPRSARDARQPHAVRALLLLRRDR